MTQQEIREFNIKCAEFLHIFDQGSQYNFLFVYADTSFFIDSDKTPDKDIYDYLLFDTDWNWLMEICINLDMKFVTTDKQQLIQQVYEKLKIK